MSEEEPEVMVEDLIATIFVNTNFGINEYDMEEVDDGDNDEVEVVEETLYVFEFNAYSSKGIPLSYMWKFGDGNEAEGIEKITENIIDSILILLDKKLDLFSSTVNNK